MSDKDMDILREARERYAFGVEADKDNRTADLDDRKFLSGEQWDSEVKSERAGRPMLTVNRLPQFVKQVTGEMRQNKPAIKVLPVDDTTDVETAKVIEAIIRHIESRSSANRVYVGAGEHAVQGGIGWFRITADYANGKSFDQDLKVALIRNPLSVVDDPDARGMVREDANWRFVSEMVSLAKFKKANPKASTTGFDVAGTHGEHWKAGEYIRVAEYWRRVPIKRTLAKFDDGSVRDITDFGKLAVGDVVQVTETEALTVAAIREATDYKVEWFTMTGVDILARGEWKGCHIPIIPVIGEEIAVGETIVRHGLIRYAKDPQRSYNYWRSASVEHIALAPKAPFIATAKQVINHQAAWTKANTSNVPVLLYDVDPLAPGPPQRSMPPTIPAAMYQEAQIADADMKATTGIYDASLGAKGNETSGKAIQARQNEGDTATFVYMDNTIAAIQHAGRIMVDLIPHYYDSERVVRIMGEDDSIEGYQRINTILPDGRVWNDVTVGEYDVEVATGPAYATRRAEAADRILSLTQSVPAIGQIGGDIIVKSLDIPYADKLSERLEKMLPPGLDEGADEKRMKAQQAMQPQQPNRMDELQLRGMTADVEGKEADTQIKKIQAAQATGEISALVQSEVQNAIQQILGQVQPEMGLPEAQ